jgi:hypothetical protein
MTFIPRPEEIARGSAGDCCILCGKVGINLPDDHRCKPNIDVDAYRAQRKRAAEELEPPAGTHLTQLKPENADNVAGQWVTNDTLSRWAIRYGEIGRPVFPCQPWDQAYGPADPKAPLTTHGWKDATTDVETRMVAAVAIRHDWQPRPQRPNLPRR